MRWIQTYTLTGWSNGSVVEWPSTLAQWFSGDMHRWWELLAHNPELRVCVDDAGLYFIAPWRVGQVLVIPPAWNLTGTNPDWKRVN